MAKNIKKRLADKIFRLSATKLAGIAFVGILVIVLMIYNLFLRDTPKSLELYAVFFAIGAALFITRSIEPWEWGIEIYHILIFGVALEFGILIPLILNIATLLLVPVHQMMEHPYKHYLTKSLPGPIIQSSILFITTIAFGLMGKYAYQAVMSNMVLYYMATLIIADYLIGNILRKTFTPLEPFRLIIYSTIGLAFNYYLITNHGPAFIGFLHSLK